VGVPSFQRVAMKKLLGALVFTAFTATAAAGQAHLLIISGIGGEPRYVEDFHNWGITMVDAAKDRLGLPPENVVFLAEDPARDPTRIAAVSRRENVEQAIADIARRAGPDDRIMILLIGHGSTDSRGARMNLPGPDLTAEEYAELISVFRTQPLVFVNTASSSGAFHEALAGPNRTIVTATRSGAERNETMFGGFFVAAFAEDGADVDRDGRVTIEEAFEYAVRETQRAYQTAGRLQLENARIEGDLELAGVFHLGGPAAGAPRDAPPEVRALYAQRQELEQRVDALRMRSGQLAEDEYQRELERLLLELARTNREIQERESSR
jgi:hypothetical protein